LINQNMDQKKCSNSVEEFKPHRILDPFFNEFRRIQGFKNSDK
jgi:hypothetical protein